MRKCSILRSFGTFTVFYTFLTVFVFSVIFIEVFRLLQRTEGFSGSLNSCDLKDVSTVIEYPTWSSMTDYPKPTRMDISANNSMDISSNKYNGWRKNATKATLDNQYNSLYNTVLSSNQYITLPPNPTLSSPVLTTKPVTNYKDAYSNALTGNPYITSAGMNSAMTELPKLKEIGLSSVNYDTLYKSAIR